jgi:hypothetical protein
MGIVWAFTGQNEARKNFFLARIIWGLIGLAIWGGFIALGYDGPMRKRVGDAVEAFAQKLHEPAKPAPAPAQSPHRGD